MALTVNSTPAAISNQAAFNVTTSLVEDSSHVNLRVRADITVDAVIVATCEKPKGIADFNFAEILKAHVPGISFARDSGDLVKVSGGSPLVAYTVLFTEVYEGADGVTATGDTDNASGSTFRYVPAKGESGVAFTEFVLHDANCRFANSTIRNNAVKFYTAIPYEYWIVFFTPVAHCELFYSKDGGAYDHSVHFDPSEGWGVVILNVGELMASVTSNLRIQIGELGGAKISEVLTIYVDSSSIDERTVLEFDGLTGGKEYLAFEGIKDKGISTIRNYRTGPTKTRKTTEINGIRKQRIETRYKDMDHAGQLEALLNSENVKKLEASYASPTEVTIVTDGAKTESTDFFTNAFDLEYDY